MLDAPLSPIGLENTMFGHTGIGGAAGFGDKVNKIGFAFVNNRQHGIGKLYKTANNLTKSLYKSL
jgi:CubicO group peptidase (beta-lactamase class C family)